MKISTVAFLRIGTVAVDRTLAALAFGLAGLSAFAAGPLPPDYDACIRGAWPTIDDAEKRAASCSKALQSKKLGLDEVALARLARGAARVVLGANVVASDDFGEALAYYDQNIDHHNPDALALYRRGVALEGLGRTDEALENFTQAIGLDPRRSFTYLDRGVLLATRTRAFERAIDDFNRALELEPRNFTALIARGSAYNRLGRNGLAIADLDQAIAMAPQSSDAYFWRASANVGVGNTAQALRDYDTAIRINPQNVAALVYRAGVYTVQGHFDLAIKDLNAAITIKSDDADAFYNRGFAHFGKGEYEQAASDYGFAISLKPRMATAYSNRCLARTMLGRDLVRALADCDTALMLSPVSPNVRATRGIVYLKLGDPQLALNEYNTALELDPNKPDALYGRGLALIAAGKVVEGGTNKAAAITLQPSIGDSFAKFGLK